MSRFTALILQTMIFCVYYSTHRTKAEKSVLVSVCKISWNRACGDDGEIRDCSNALTGDKCNYREVCQSLDTEFTMCKNRATCHRINEKQHRCICRPPWYGGEKEGCKYYNECNEWISAKKTTKGRSECGVNGLCGQFPSLHCMGCKPGFFGEKCAFSEACSEDKPNPCANGGTCFPDPRTGDFSCHCPLGFVEKNCSRRDPCFKNNACLHRGRCIDDGGSNYICQCPPDGLYDGAHCEIYNRCRIGRQDPCPQTPRLTSNECFPCQNGLCVADDTTLPYTYTCACDDKHIGNECQFLRSSVDFYFPAKLRVGEAGAFLIVVKTEGSDFHLRIDLGNNFIFVLTSRSLRSKSDINLPGQLNLLGQDNHDKLRTDYEPDAKYYAFRHRYTKSGDFITNSTHFNGDSTYSYLSGSNIHTIQVTASSSKCQPTVNLLNCGHDVNSIPVYRRSARFVIPTSIYHDCTKNPNDDIAILSFEWRMYHLNEITPFPDLRSIEDLGEIAGVSQNETKYVVFQPLKVTVGRYWIEVFVFVNNDVENGIVDYCYFNVEAGPPFPIIIGGASRTIDSNLDTFRMDASHSFDPSFPEKSNFLKYTWTFDNGSPCSEVSSSPCSESVIKIDTSGLTQSEYNFRVDVTNRDSGLSAFTNQMIYIRPNSIEIRVDCLKNCGRGGKWGRNDKFLLQCSCSNCESDEGISYKYVFDLALGDVSEPTPGSGLFRIQLIEQKIKDEFLFTCTGTVSQTNQIGSSSFLISLNPRTTIGKCSIDPLSGTFLETEFTITCEEFETANDPLVFVVYASPVGSSLGLLEKGLLMFYEASPILRKLSLPLGNEDAAGNDWRVLIDVEVIDSFGYMVRAPQLEVKVLPPSSTSNDYILSHFLARSEDGSFSNKIGGILGDRLAAGDDQRALQLILNILYINIGGRPPVVWPNPEIHADVLARAIMDIPLHNQFVVSQVNQALYLLLQIEKQSDETLRSSARILFEVANSTWHYVSKREEVVNTEDISTFGKSAKDSARKIMIQGHKRGSEQIQAIQTSTTLSETNIDFLDEPDEIVREYFSEDHSGLLVEEDTISELVNSNLTDEIQQHAKTTLMSYYALETVLDSTGEREVISDRIDLIAPDQPQLSVSVQVRSAEDIAGKTFVNAKVGFIIPQNAENFLPRGISHPIQVEMTETDFSLNPFFDDLSVLIQTPVASIILKDQNLMKLPIEFGDDSPIHIFLPFNNIADLNSRISLERVTVRLIPFAEIDQSNTDVKIFHLSLNHGSKFSVTVTTEKSPGVQYLVTAVRDVLPEKRHFCSTNENLTKHLKDGFTTGEFDAGHLGDADTHSSLGGLVDYYIGVWPFDPIEIGSYNVTYTIGFSQRSCFIRDEDLEKWSGRGCEVGERGNATHIHCVCSHLSIFGGSIFVPPNGLDIVNDIQLFLEFEENSIVATTVALILVSYLCLLVYCVWKDIVDRREHYGITIMTEIGEDFKNTYYLITVYTGSRPFAGTSSNVSLQIYGSNGRSIAYVIKDQSVSVLNRGGIDSFFVSSVKDLGELDRIRVWHDNSGNNPGWYLRKIIIRNVKSEVEWYFFVEKWLSMSVDSDPSLIREIPASTEKVAIKWTRRFNDRLVDAFNDSHLWLSVFLRLPTSNFTRAQRLSCAVGILTSFMLINIAFYGIPLQDFSEMIEFGSFSINPLTIQISIQTAICGAAVGICLIFLFQRIRKRFIPSLVIWKNSGKRRKQSLNDDIHESHLFLHGETNKRVITAPKPTLEEEEGNRPFAIPATDMHDLEHWIETRIGSGINEVPAYNEPSPNIVVRTVHAVGGAVSGAKTTINNLLRVGRRAIITSIREEEPFSFHYSGNNDNRRIEELIDEEIQRHADNEHKWTKTTTKKKLDKIEIQQKLEIPEILEPIQIVETASSSDENLVASYTGIALELYQMPPVEKKFWYFPWWFIYVAWTVVVFTIFATSFLTILFGLRYGYLKSLDWLSGITITFFQSLLVMQPIQIFTIALLFTLLLRKIHATDEDRFQILLLEGDEDIGNPKPLTLRIFRPSKPYPPLSGHITFKLRHKARQRNRLLIGLSYIIFNVFLIVFLSFIAHSNQSTTQTFQLTENIRNMLELHADFEDCDECPSTFSELTTEAELYEYLRDIFLEVVNPRTRYSGTRFKLLRRSDPVILRDETSYLISIPRLRQVRIKRGVCQIPKTIKEVIVGTDIATEENDESRTTFPCAGHYEEHLEDEGTYNPNWREIVGTRTWTSSNDVWKFKEFNETKSVRREGSFGTYEGSGFVAELGRDYQRSANVLYYLQRTDWIDSRTRAVFIEFLVFNANVNLFADVVLMVEKSPSQALLTSSRITCLRLSYPDEHDGFELFIVICHVLVFIFLIILIVIFIRTILYRQRHYGYLGIFTSFWLWSDFFQIIFIGVSLYKAAEHSLLLVKMRTEFDSKLINEYISFQEVALSEVYQTNAFAGAIILCVIKLWKLLVFTFVRFYIMSLALKLSARFLLAFILLLGILLSAFTVWGHLSFGSTFFKFHTLRDTFLELIYQLINVTIYPDLYSSNRILGPTFYFLFGFFICCIGLTIFVALLNQGLLEAKEIAYQRPSWDTYWSWIKNEFLSYFPSFTNQKNLHSRASIHPLKLHQMKQKTISFMRTCSESREIQRIREMKIHTENFLRGTRCGIISKNKKLKIIRENLNRVHVSERKINEMRVSTIKYIRRVQDLDFNAKHFRPFSEFNAQVLKIRLRKLQEKGDLIQKKVSEVVQLELEKRKKNKGMMRKFKRQSQGRKNSLDITSLK